MLSRLVLSSGVGVLPSGVGVLVASRGLSGRQLRYQVSKPSPRFLHAAFSHTKVTPLVWGIHARHYSTEQRQDKETEPTAEEEVKAQQREKEGEEAEQKVDDAPIEEPGWRKSQATRQTPAFQTGGGGQQEAKMPNKVAWIYLMLGAACVGIVTIKVYLMGTHAMRENSADPNLVIRKALDQLYKQLEAHQLDIDKAGKTPAQPYEPLVNFNGTVATVCVPLHQVNSNARLGTIYMDLAREGDYFQLKSGYIDFFWGKTFDLVEAGILKQNEFTYYLFAPEFSAAESMKLAYEAMQTQAEMQAQQTQQKQQR